MILHAFMSDLTNVLPASLVIEILTRKLSGRVENNTCMCGSAYALKYVFVRMCLRVCVRVCICSSVVSLFGVALSTESVQNSHMKLMPWSGIPPCSKIPNGKFLVEFVSIIFDPLRGLTVE